MNFRVNLKSLILNYSYCLIVILQVVMLYAISSETSRIISICTYLFFGLGVLMFGTVVIAEKNWPFRWRLLFIIIIYIVFLIQLVSANRTVKISAYSFALMLTVWSVASTIELSDLSKKVTAWAIILQGLLLIALSYSEYAYVLRNEYDSVIDSLTLGFPNPNQTAIIIYSTISVLMIVREDLKNKFLKLLTLAELAWLFYLLVLTDARISLLACIFVIFLQIRHKQTKRKFKFTEYMKIFVFIMCILPLLFYLVYNYMYDNNILMDATFFGKSFYSGRNTVFRWYLRYWNNLWLGNLNYFSFANAHNAALSILVNTGVVGYILHLIYTYSEISHLCKKRNTNYISIMVILSYFVIGCAEAAIFISGSIYYVTLLTVCILANNTKELKE